MANTTKTWTPQEDAAIRESATRNGVTNREANTRLRKQLKVSRHQLRSRMNVLGLTDYGRRKLGISPDNPSVQAQRKLEETVRFQNQELKGLTRKVAALEGNSSIIAAMKEELHEWVQPIAPLPAALKTSDKANLIDEVLVMHLSDEHADQIVLPHRVGGLENYNFQIALARAERYVQTVIEFTQKTLSNYRFKELYILAYGDHSSGEIHDAVSHSQYKNIFRNTLAIAQMHALMIRDLAPYFENVHVIGVVGNHGRKSLKKDFHGAHNNWDHLIHLTTSLICKDIKNVDFVLPDAYSVNVDINGTLFNVSHGDDVKSWNGIPFYGIERRSRRLSTLHAMQGRSPDVFVCGHFHQLSSMQVPGAEVLINGSFKLTDEFAYNALGAAGEPMQLIHGVHASHGITWRLPVRLRHTEESKGPKRYAVNVE